VREALDAIGYITPKDMLAGHHQEILAERNWKLEPARERLAGRLKDDELLPVGRQPGNYSI
jgi:hypothetical protein